MLNEQPLAPEYRYFTVDLMSNEIIAEIPFRGVSYERAIKAAGEFRGKIPVIEDTKNLDLYESTMPGKTALFVVRNNVCEWGGIIWNREYNVVSRDLSLSGAEFTSYLYRRKIWKTWGHQYGATVVVAGGVGKVYFDYGSNIAVAVGSTVKIEFYDPKDFQYTGHFKVASTPAPTLQGFEVEGGYAIADLSSVEVRAGVAYITTKSAHGFNTGDIITIDSSNGAPYSGSVEVLNTDLSQPNKFSFSLVSPDRPFAVDSGQATRTVPDGVYTSATISVRTDTYDYIRSLIDTVFMDFVGSEFPNVYIEPGVSLGFNVVAKELDSGFAFIETDTPHNLAVGQAVQIQDVGPGFDGEVVVTSTPSDTVFVYKAGGAMVPTVVAPVESTISQVSLYGNVATFTTTSAHTYLVGQTVSVFVGYGLSELNGDHVITATPTTTSFQCAVISRNTIPQKTLTNATATVGGSVFKVVSGKIVGNVATLGTAEDHDIEAGDSVVVADVKRSVQVIQKSFDAANSLATVTTSTPHNFEVGSSVVLDGLQDVTSLVSRKNTTTSVTFTTSPAHNLKVGDSVDVSGMLDEYPLVSKSLTSNVGSLTTKFTHNIPNGTEIFVDAIIDKYTITNKALSGNKTTITLSAAHNFQVNDSITVAGVVDTGQVVSKSAEKGVAVLILSAPHNFLEAEEVTISGVGSPFNGKRTLLAVTETSIVFEIRSKSLILPATSSGTVTGSSSIFNGTFLISDKTSTTVSYITPGQDITPRTATGSARGLSILNGTHTLTAVTGTTMQFSVVGNNVSSAAIPPANEDEDEIQPTVSMVSRYLGTKTLTAVTRNTVTFATSGLVADPAPREVYGVLSKQSMFNGTRTITAVTDDTFRFALSGTSNVLEEGTTYLSTATSSVIFPGTYTVTAVDTPNRLFSFAKVYQDIANSAIQSRGSAVVRPTAIVNSFGPFPGNADIKMQYSTREYSGVNVVPVSYRGFELTNVGEALDVYSDSIDGFEYRIDCAFDPVTKSFTKTFVLIPINFPDPPPPGEVSPISRFGADKLVFEYPGGSITDMVIAESADESSTRFFALGETDLGPDAGPNMSIASAEDLLSGRNNSRRWPLLDESETISGVDDELELYSYAKRYLSETRPPSVSLSVSVNGSIAPLVGSYAPGDWCSLIINDDFMLMRLASDSEPRSDVIVRKIEAYKVTVPDSVTFPEKVDLTLVPEWEVDKRG